MKKLIGCFMVICSISLITPVVFASGNDCSNNANLANEAINRVTEVVVHDIFTPPVSSRIYAYTAIAGYTAFEMAQGNEPFTTKLNEFPVINLTSANEDICPSLAMLSATFKTAKALLFSEEMVDKNLEEMVELYFGNFSAEIREASIEFGSEIASYIVEWSADDRYRNTRNLERYSLLNKEWSWEPTPPDHTDPVEPYWNKIRTFVLDSASACRPVGPTPFDTAQTSTFYLEAMEVFDTKKTLTEDQKATVWFWDDNPFVTVHEGHLVYAKKKVSPAGHWMGITGIAITQDQASLSKAIKSYALVSIALADAFISCWDEKYRSNLIRPVTYINTYIDPQWEPYLQTPPFPEYTSGHSVISASAASMLTNLFGNDFAYTDSVETLYGLEPRNYKSFFDASNEAAYSRLYGGIHYRPGIEVGVLQGKEVCTRIIAKLL